MSLPRREAGADAAARNHAHCAVALCCEALGKMIDEMAFVITGDPEYLRQGPKIVQGYEPLK